MTLNFEVHVPDNNEDAMGTCEWIFQALDLREKRFANLVGMSLTKQKTFAREWITTERTKAGPSTESRLNPQQRHNIHYNWKVPQPEFTRAYGGLVSTRGARPMYFRKQGTSAFSKISYFERFRLYSGDAYVQDQNTVIYKRDFRLKPQEPYEELVDNCRNDMGIE
ncbi:hypothetical protein C8R41DRAFT_863144 [Lentinula lateritia]|uniref:Uncharacterized protein n=1 Tax=Lentinula lateritia TaxID=40482 RepID=A0ABQ8VX26_9AGAR|nr:hypothetical protein C8R41DRAFT_863144 [Lentinula lateritia]